VLPPITLPGSPTITTSLLDVILDIEHRVRAGSAQPSIYFRSQRFEGFEADRLKDAEIRLDLEDGAKGSHSSGGASTTWVSLVKNPARAGNASKPIASEGWRGSAPPLSIEFPAAFPATCYGCVVPATGADVAESSLAVSAA
jgi:hypothetical protein